MGKHCLQLVLTLPLFSIMHCDFPNKLTRQIHALALYSTLGLSAVQTSVPKSKTWGNTLLVLLLQYVTYRIVYRIVTTVSGYIVLWKNVSLQAYPVLDHFIANSMSGARGQCTISNWISHNPLCKPVLLCNCPVYEISGVGKKGFAGPERLGAV